MSPILTLEAEIRAALKTAGAPRVPLDLLGEIQACVKLAGEAAPVTPPAPAAPALKPPAPAPATTPAAPAAPAAAPVAPAPAAPPAGTPAAGSPPPGAPATTGKPTTPPPQPYKVPGSRPEAPQGAMSSAWDAVKNNWDVAAIPLSLLAMMFGGKAGKMLGALGMAAGGYGLYNRYQNMQHYGDPLPRIQGETDAQYQTRQNQQTVKNMQAGFRANQARLNADKQFKEPLKAAEEQFQNLLTADPALAEKAQAAIEAKNAMWEAKTAFNDVLKNNPRDAKAIADAKAAADQAEAVFTETQGDQATQQALAPIMQAREAADHLKWQHQNAMKQWAEWEKANPQLGSSLKAVNAMAPGVMINQIRNANPELAGATERTVQDLMYRLGHGDKPADYSSNPMTPEEDKADRVLAWLLQDPKAVEAMKDGGPGMLAKLGIKWNDPGAGKRWN